MQDRIGMSWVAHLLVALALCVSWNPVAAQDEAKETHEPVFRVPKVARLPETPTTQQPVTPPADGPIAETANAADAPMEYKPAPITATGGGSAIGRTPHPLDRAIQIAEDGLRHMQENIHDYTAVLVKRERVQNRLGEPAYMRIKIRNPRNINGKQVPFSVYMKFLKPRSAAGREVIWVEGQNNNNLIAHEGGLLGVKRFTLEPTGWIAMKGNRYPIYDAGLENLVRKLIEKASRDRAAGSCEVNYVEGAKINGRPCTLIEVIHSERCAPFEFYKAKVYIDDELNIPVRYAAYDWPSRPGAKPPLIEEYTYVNVKLNVGLTDLDFSPDNPSYKFPSR